MDTYHGGGYTTNMKDSALLAALLVYLTLPVSHGSSCSAFNVSEGLQGTPLQPHYEYPDNVTFSCDNTSLALIGRPIRKCLHTGSWDAQLPVCQAIRCPLIPVPKNGTLLYEYKNVSVIAQFSCDVTHILIGQQLITCHQNGSWTDTPPRCLVDCASPPSLENAIFSYNCSLPTCRVLYSCEEGYTFNGSEYRQCTHTGAWSDTPQSCELIMCTWPNLPSGGKFSTSIPPSGEMFAYNTTLRYTCKADLVLVGDGTLWCGPAGLWKGNRPRCLKASEIAASTESSNVSSTVHSTTATLNVTSPTTTRQTTTTSTTTTTTVKPRPVGLCPKPPLIANGSPELPFPSQRRPGGLIKYHCAPGYVLEGPHELECLDNESWSAPVPHCVALLPLDTVSTPPPFQWTQVFITHKKWIGEYEFKKRHYYFEFHVESVDLVNKGSILGLFSEDHGSKFDVKGFRRADEIVFEIEAMLQANARIKNTDWYVHGKLTRGICTWKYAGRISSPTEGFTTLSMESYIEEMLDDPMCSNRHHMTLIVVSVSVAVLMVAAVAIVAYYCSRRKGGFRSSGHRSLTSFENPVYEYEHSLK